MPNEEYQVIISSAAASQLIAHAAFLANVSPEAAEGLVQAFEQAAASLRFSPMRGAYLRSKFLPSNTYRQLVFEKRYMLIYQVADRHVYVDHVVDCRQDYQWLLVKNP